MSPRVFDDARIPLRVTLCALWLTLITLFVFADILRLYQPGEIDRIRTGMMGPFEASQGALLLAVVLMTLPARTVFLTVALPPRAGRALTIGMAASFTLVDVANVMGET